MRYTPKRSNHIADAVFTVCFASAAILFITSRAAVPYKSAAHILSTSFFTIGLYIMIRYRLVKYSYVIRAKNISENGYSDISDFDFIVEKVKGNRAEAECRLSIDDLAELKKLPQSKRGSRDEIKRYGKGLKLYKYTVSMYPSDPYLIIFHDNSDVSGESRIGVVFEPDKKMADYISDLCETLNTRKNFGR